MLVHDRRWMLNKLLCLGTGLTGLALLGGCIYESAEPVCVDGPSAKLLLSDSGLTLYGGEEFIIQWVATCVDFVRIEFSRNKGIDWISIAEKVLAKEGKYSWEVPQLASVLALFRLVDISTDQVLAVSPEPMALIPKIILQIKNHSALAVIGGVLELDRPSFGTIAIVRTGLATFKILNLNCTHNGCPVNSRDNGETWDCPCHGSQFSKLGCVLQGPAQRPLSIFDHKFDSTAGLLVIYNIQREPSTC